MQRTLGIDVSHYQGEVNWPAVAGSEVEFCFIKATEGASWTDDRFERNWRGAQDTGVFRGPYHFGRVGADARAQAAHFFSVVGALGFRDLPPVLDIEEANGHSAEVVKNWTEEFLLEARQLFGRVPIVYTGHFWRQQMGNPDDSFFGEHPLWLAGYISEPNLKIPAAWKDWTFWQYSEGIHNGPRKIPGVAPCDQNLFAGGLAELNQLCLGSAPPVSPLPEPSESSAWPGVYLIWRQSPAMVGAVVRQWQARMAHLDFIIDVDDAYGPQSKRICQSFQRSRGLSADGIVGPETWRVGFMV